MSTALRRLFYASSACIYPEGRQLETEIEGGGLKEEHAWPAQVSFSRLLVLTFHVDVRIGYQTWGSGTKLVSPTAQAC